MREIEPQPVRRNQAALLGDMFAQAVAKGCMQQVGGAMVGAGRSAAIGVNRLMEGFADAHLALRDPGPEGVQLAERFRCVLYNAFEALERSQFSCITDLSAAFAIEGRLIEDQRDGFTLPGGIGPNTILDDRLHDAFAFGARIAGKFGRAGLFGDVIPKFVGCLFARTLPGGAGRCLLLGHRRIEACAIDGQAAHSQRVFGQIIGEAEGVIKLERSRAR